MTKNDDTPEVRKGNGFIDWGPILKEYLEDPNSSQASLAKKYKVTEQAVYNRAKKENWGKLRAQLEEKTKSLLVDNVAEQRAKLDKKHTRLYNRGQRLVLKTLKYMEVGEPLLDKQGNAVLDSKGKPILLMPPAKQVEHIVKALKVTIDGERAMAGLPSDVKGITDGKGNSIAEGLGEAFAKAEKRYKELQDNGSLAKPARTSK
jgi:hypothetical protein